MRDNPLENQAADGADFAGDNFVRYTGDAPQMAKVQMFAWQASERGNEVHLQANPTQVAILHKEYESKKDQVRDTTQKSILEKYGGEEYLEAPPKELLLAQSENYVEYSRTGRVIKGQERAKARSKYEEDGKPRKNLKKKKNFKKLTIFIVFVNNHTTVWGSYWAEGKWGYKCCRSNIKNSYCTGQAGIAAQQASVLIK